MRGFEIQPVKDTLRESRNYRGKQKSGHSLAAVCERELGVQMDKSMQKSDWTSRPLTKAQMEYTALDAEVLLDLHRFFQNRIPDLDV